MKPAWTSFSSATPSAWSCSATTARCRLRSRRCFTTRGPCAARAVDAAGACAVAREAMPRNLAGHITRELRTPTIGIGAGPDCDGQVLVLHDILGPPSAPTQKSARQYANLGEIITNAVRE